MKLFIKFLKWINGIIRIEKTGPDGDHMLNNVSPSYGYDEYDSFK